MSNWSPRVYLNTPDMAAPIGAVQGTDGQYRLLVSSNGAAASPASPSVDAFGRSRTSMPTSIFDAKQVYDAQPLLFVNHTVGGGLVTYQNARASSSLTVSTGATDRALRQTKRYLNYQPGKSQLVFATYNFHGAVPNVSKRVGYYDDENGVFVELNSVGGAPVYSIVKRSSVTGASTVTVPQDQWNLDSLDGTGPSGRTLDPSTTMILVIDFEWLGVGEVRIGFDFGGELIYAHRFPNANIGTAVYMRTPNLPVRWEIVNTAASAGANMESICCSVQSEGGANPLSLQRTASRGVTAASATTTLQSMLSLRLRSGYERATVFPLNAECVTTDTGVNYYGQIVLNPTYGSALGGWTTVTNSAVEYSTSVVSVTGGTVLGEFYGISGAPGKSGAAEQTVAADLASILALASDYAGTSDVVSLALRTFTGSSASSFYAAMQWVELL